VAYTLRPGRNVAICGWRGEKPLRKGAGRGGGGTAIPGQRRGCYAITGRCSGRRSRLFPFLLSLKNWYIGRCGVRPLRDPGEQLPAYTAQRVRSRRSTGRAWRESRQYQLKGSVNFARPGAAHFKSRRYGKGIGQDSGRRRGRTRCRGSAAYAASKAAIRCVRRDLALARGF